MLAKIGLLIFSLQLWIDCSLGYRYIAQSSNSRLVTHGYLRPLYQPLSQTVATYMPASVGLGDYEQSYPKVSFLVRMCRNLYE